MKSNLFFTQITGRYFLAALLPFLTVTFKAQISNFPWTETFEDSSPTRSGWTQIYETNTMSWTFAAAATTGSSGVTAFSGTKFANFPANSSTADKTKLVSPPLNTSGLSTPKISFYLINPQVSGNANWVRIYYRFSATDSWTMMMGFQPPFDSWFFFGNIGIPPNVYQVAIECENAQGYSTLIDNFTISNDVLSVNDVLNSAKSGIKYYPNPVKDRLNYTGREKISEMTIYDTTGKKVRAYKLDSDKGNIDVSSLKNGMYIISGKTGSSTETFKIIKN